LVLFYKKELRETMERIGKYLMVEKLPDIPGRKIYRWHVRGNGGGLLGIISWHGPWRQYTFDPEEMTTFNKECLEDIARFLGRINKEHRAKKGSG